MRDVDVVVVGAGLAGLSAACALVDDGKTVTVLEARDRVGGRTEGGVIDGHPVELGGTWLCEGHEEIYALVKELRLETFRPGTTQASSCSSSAGSNRASTARRARPRS
jgi:monoamine oxidase